LDSEGTRAIGEAISSEHIVRTNKREQQKREGAMANTQVNNMQGEIMQNRI